MATYSYNSNFWNLPQLANLRTQSAHELKKKGKKRKEEKEENE